MSTLAYIKKGLEKKAKISWKAVSGLLRGIEAKPEKVFTSLFSPHRSVSWEKYVANGGKSKVGWMFHNVGNILRGTTKGMDEAASLQLLSTGADDVSGKLGSDLYRLAQEGNAHITRVPEGMSPKVLKQMYKDQGIDVLFSRGQNNELLAVTKTPITSRGNSFIPISTYTDSTSTVINPQYSNAVRNIGETELTEFTIPELLKKPISTWGDNTGMFGRRFRRLLEPWSEQGVKDRIVDQGDDFIYNSPWLNSMEGSPLQKARLNKLLHSPIEATEKNISALSQTGKPVNPGNEVQRQQDMVSNESAGVFFDKWLNPFSNFKDKSTGAKWSSGVAGTLGTGFVGGYVPYKIFSNNKPWYYDTLKQPGLPQFGGAALGAMLGNAMGGEQNRLPGMLLGGTAGYVLGNMLQKRM